MNAAIDHAITTLEQELEAVDQHRGELESALEHLRRLGTKNGSGFEMFQRPRRGRKPGPKPGRPRKSGSETERTNERTNEASAGPTQTAEPP